MIEAFLASDLKEAYLQSNRLLLKMMTLFVCNLLIGECSVNLEQRALAIAAEEGNAPHWCAHVIAR
jgi:hypothetical protein